MADIIATIWDFDKTLIHGYMQEPIFEDYKIDRKKFWSENYEKIEKLKEQGLSVNEDIFYLNHMLSYVREGKLSGLSNEKLLSYGKKQKFYDGVEELFYKIANLTGEFEQFKNEGIIFENYIISSGLKKVIEGTNIAKYVKNIWGCEFSQSQNPTTSKNEISDVIYSIDNTTKTRALFEINKGVNIKELNLDVNSPIPQKDRRIQFHNMIYIADGPSDIPAFSVVNRNGGSTFAVCEKNNHKAFDQVEKMRNDGRIQMYAESCYTENSTANMWIVRKLSSLALNILNERQASIQKYGKGTPQHLN